MNVEDVDVTGAELLEGSLHGNMKRLHMVPNVRRVLLDVLTAALIVARILSG